MLAELQRRLNNDEETEQQEALAQLRKLPCYGLRRASHEHHHHPYSRHRAGQTAIGVAMSLEQNSPEGWLPVAEGETAATAHQRSHA